MAKVKLYMRVGKKKRGGYKVVSNSRPIYNALDNGSEYKKEVYPTVAFALDVDIPDGLFDKASEVMATVTLSEEFSSVTTKVESPIQRMKMKSNPFTILRIKRKLLWSFIRRLRGIYKTLNEQAKVGLGSGDCIKIDYQIEVLIGGGRGKKRLV